MSGFYDNSPGMVQDIGTAAGAQAAQPPAAAASAQDGATERGWLDDVTTDVDKDRENTGGDSQPRSPYAADVSPYGPDVAVGVQRAAEAKGEDAETAKSLGESWHRTFEHFGVPGNHIPHLIEAGMQAADGPPDEATAKAWATEAQDRLAGEYGGSEGGARALETAKQWVKLHPQLGAWLDKTGLGDHPRVVAAIVSTARMAKDAGKLK